MRIADGGKKESRVLNVVVVVVVVVVVGEPLPVSLTDGSFRALLARYDTQQCRPVAPYSTVNRWSIYSWSWILDNTFLTVFHCAGISIVTSWKQGIL